MRRIKLKKRKNKLRIRRKLVLTSTLVLLFVLGIGYSALSVDLNINGNITVKEYEEPYLYNVLKRASQEGYAQEYTGSHRDSFTENPSEKIYYWYAPNDTEGNEKANEILEKNNVIFANHCWQMIRTTDTGGVKMIYNGEAENGKCLNTRENHVGYNGKSELSLSSNYYYGTSYTYDKTNDVFSLSGTVTTGTIQTGQYTCSNTNSNGTCNTLYLVESLVSGTRYNVILLDGNSNYNFFGKLAFQKSSSSISYAGYMYKTEYNPKSRHPQDIAPNTSEIINSSYWYADTYDWNITNADSYTLTNPYQISSSADYQSLVGKYTLLSTDMNGYNDRMYYIASVSSRTMYLISMGNENGSTHELSYYNHTYTYGTSYTDNGDGTYTINNPTTIHRTEWQENYNRMRDKYVCINATNNTCSKLLYILPGISAGNSWFYISSSDKFTYANSFTWDGQKYHLDSTNSVQLWDLKDSTNLDILKNYHYTCFNTSGECSTLSYVFWISYGHTNYLSLTNGKGISTVLNEMLYDDDVNQINSIIKTGLDAWYKKYMLDYTNYIEDTIFCNDRSLSDPQGNGFNPNGGDLSNNTFFKNHESNTDLSCSNDTDKFSINNSKAQLTYPIGLLTISEKNIVNNNNIFKAGNYFWTISPSYYSDSVSISTIAPNGYNSNDSVSQGRVVRPVISLKPGIKYVSGTGSMADPYVVNTFQDDDWATIINNVRNGNTANYQVGDTKEVDMGEFGTHTLRLVNKSTPSECNNSDFSQSACGFVLEFADIISSTSMNTNFSNAGGWSAMSLRNYVNNDIYNALPTELKGGIIDTKVVSTRGSNDDPSISTDKMFLQTIKELYGLNILDTFGDNTRQLDYYSNLGITGGDIRVARIYNFYNNNYYPFWLRSAMTGSIADFYIINSDGTYGRDYVSNYLGVSPSFRIG